MTSVSILAASGLISVVITVPTSALSLTDSVITPVAGVALPQPSNQQNQQTVVPSPVQPLRSPTLQQSQPTPETEDSSSQETSTQPGSPMQTTSPAPSLFSESLEAAQTPPVATQTSYTAPNRSATESGVYNDDVIRDGFAKLSPEQVTTGGLTALGSIVLGLAMLALSKVRGDQSLVGLFVGN